MRFLYLFWLLIFPLLVFSYQQSVSFKVYSFETSNKDINLATVLKNNNFTKVNNINTLNFGVSNKVHWLKIEITNAAPLENYKLHIATITPDSIAVYILNGNIYTKTYIGEGFASTERFLNFNFKTTAAKTTTLYLQVIGNGQPIVLPLSIYPRVYDVFKLKTVLITGLIYGIIFFIIVINLVFFISTGQKLYLYFVAFNVFGWSIIFSFDGFIKLFIFTNSIYWNNELVAIGFIASFISTNFYVSEFLNIKKYDTVLNIFFKLINVVLLLQLAISFWHPVGFKIYILLNLITLTAEAFLLLTCVLYIQKKEKQYFLTQLTSVIFLIVFGTITQFYFAGLLPISFITQHVLYFMILPQIFIQTFALAKRLKLIIKEKSRLQQSLLTSSALHSQSLIFTLETERKRMAHEFHDSIGQNLLVIRNRVLLLLKKDMLPTHTEVLNGLAAITSETLDEIRTIAQDLRPSTLDTIGITASIKLMIDKIQKSTSVIIKLVFEEGIDDVLPKDTEINFYRILQELLNNLLKHAKATHATVVIEKTASQLKLYVKDNGIGFDTKLKIASGIGNGLSGIKERVNILKGIITIKSYLYKGTAITVIIPIKNEK